MTVNESDVSKLLESTALVIVGVVLSSSGKLLERVVIGRLLSPEAYGEFNVALAVFTLGTTLGAAGFTQGVPRYMARFDELRDVRGAWLTGLTITTVVSLFITVTLLFGTDFVVPRFFTSEGATPLYLLFVLSIPLYVSFQVGGSAIRGLENTRYRILTADICYPGFRLLIVGVLLLSGLGVIATGIGYLLTLVITTVLTHVLLNRLFPLLGEFRLHGREMAAFSAPLVLSAIMSTLMARTDTLMLGYFTSAFEVGIYNAAYPLAGVLTIVLGTVGYMYLPVASRMEGDEESSIESVYEITTKWVYLLAFPVFVVLLVYPSEIVSLVFGREYASGGLVLRILAIGFFTNAAVGRNRETLMALGETKFVLVSNTVAFAFNFLLNLALIPSLGFVGAAIASASSFAILNVVVYAFLRVRFGITPFTRRSARAFLTLPVVLVPLGIAIGELVPGSLPVLIVFTAAFAALTVTIAVIIGSLEAEDLVVVEFIEDRANVRIPVVRRYIPDQ
jgi:O-antigen/teichoic acid export membrane protein